MNLVVPSGCSVAHAEMVAIMIAQQVVGDFDLGGEGKPVCELVASTEPCAMCFGAKPWSGVRSLLCEARDEDARSVGFDEGGEAVGLGRPRGARHLGQEGRAARGSGRRGEALLRKRCRHLQRQAGRLGSAETPALQSSNAS